MATIHPVDAVHDALEAKGCHHLANEITILPTAIRRPRRQLTPREAMAMAAAWQAGYSAMGVALCPHAVPRQPHSCDCADGAAPDFNSERVLHAWLEELVAQPVD